jgi:hypothetical protein
MREMEKINPEDELKSGQDTADQTVTAVVSHLLNTLEQAYKRFTLIAEEKHVQEEITLAEIPLCLQPPQVTTLQQRQPALLFNPIVEYTFSRNSFSPDGKKLMTFDDIPPEDIELFRSGLSLDGTKLSLRNFDDGDSSDINSIETFLFNNPHVIYFRWEKMDVTDEECKILRKISSLQSLELPTCGLCVSANRKT